MRYSLLEAATPTKLKIGDTLTTPDGVKIKIKNIYVTRFHMSRPETQVDYEYKMPGGKKGKETNSIVVLQGMVKA